jgi:hypothetical protein
MFLGCAQSVSAQWSPIADPTPTPGTNIYYNSGNVGIGTYSPANKLTVRGSSSEYNETILRIERANDGNVGLSAVFGLDSANTMAFGTVTNHPFLLTTNNTERMRIDTSGNVGIGKTPDSSYKLDVAGNINSSQTITGNNIVAKYQDVAEWVPSSEQLAAGTVVVLDSTRSNQVISSSVSYDTRVAGVISAQPGITLGEKSDSKVLVATTGRVKVKVDASKGPIRIGDLLVTSDVPGVAMKSDAVNLGGVQFHRPGTLIGKALEPLERGKGEILVLLSLQ